MPHVRKIGIKSVFNVIFKNDKKIKKKYQKT